nr:hypothetical protein [Tanacetum cinerariifolium]
MVDFIEASPLRYALTVKPTVYVSHIRQFWSTARIETMKEGTQILATVDDILRTVTESSLRRNLKLQDEEGIRFNEFSSNIATTLVCLVTNRTYNFSKMIFDGLVKNVNNKVSKFLMYPRFLTMCLRMSQFGKITHTHTYVVPFHTRKLFTTLRVNSPSFSGRIVPFFDTMLVQQGEGSDTPTEPHHTPSHMAQPPSHTTHSSSTLPPITTTSIPSITLSETTPIRQYTRRARIAQSYALPTVADEPESPLRDVNQGEACPTDSGFIADQNRATIGKSSTLPHDSAPRVTSPAADEGKDREGTAAERSRDDAPVKERNLDEGEATAERAKVPTGSGSIPTASPSAAEVPTGSDVVPTASLVFATATVIDAQVARELEEQLEREDQRRSEQIARDIKIVRIHAEEELQVMIDGLDRNNETVAKYLQEYHQFASELPIERRIELISDLVKYQDNYAKIYKFQSQQRKLWTKKQKRDYYMVVIRIWKQMENFIPMGSQEEAERIKRKGLSLEQESAKKQKTSEEVTEEAKSPDEVLEEKVKDMMQLVPIEEVYVEALQVKHPIIDWKRLVNETLSNRPPTSDKEMELWVELSRLYEPYDKDQLWTHTQNLMHAPVEWKLYDSCGVHHVTAKDKEIFMLVEKDYPLRKGLALVMISYKLQVENYSRLENDLILKIYKIASTPRQQCD